VLNGYGSLVPFIKKSKIVSQQNPLEQAKQGNPHAIAFLLNKSLQPKGITAKAARQNCHLQIIVESEQVPNQEKLIEFIRNGLLKLDSSAVRTVKVWGKQKGENTPKWSQEFSLFTQAVSTDSNQPEPAIIPESREIETPVPAVEQQSIPQKPQLSVDRRWYGSSPVVILSLLIFFPVGFFLMWRFGHWSKKAKWAATGVFACLMVARMLVPTPPDTQTAQVAQPSPSASPSVEPSPSVAPPKCREAAGRLWTGVKLYLDSECTKNFATVVGGNNRYLTSTGERVRAVKIAFNTGEIEWKTREAVNTQAYVMDNDPAIEAGRWLVLDE
jgi:hypothetical protein